MTISYWAMSIFASKAKSYDDKGRIRGGNCLLHDKSYDIKHDVEWVTHNQTRNVLDRLAKTAYRIEFSGDSMRK